MEYVTPIDCGGTDPERPYVDGCASMGQPGSLTPARFANLMLAEGRNLVEGAGLTLDPNNDAQWLDAVCALISQKMAAGSGGLVNRSRTLLDVSSTATSAQGEIEAMRVSHTNVSDGRLRVIARGGHESLGNPYQFGIASTVRLQHWNGSQWIGVDGGQTYLASQLDERIKGFFHLEYECAATSGSTELFRLTHLSGPGGETSAVFNRSTLLVEEWDDGLPF